MLGRLAALDNERVQVEKQRAATRRKLEARLKDVEAALLRLEKAKIEGEYEGDLSLYQQLRQDYRQEREQIRTELGAEPETGPQTDYGALIVLCADIAKTWAYLHPAEQKQALLGLTEALCSDFVITDMEEIALKPRG
jgi:hypothetical protein